MVNSLQYELLSSSLFSPWLIQIEAWSTRITSNLHISINVSLVPRQWLQVPSTKFHQILKYQIIQATYVNILPMFWWSQPLTSIASCFNLVGYHWVGKVFPKAVHIGYQAHTNANAPLSIIWVQFHLSSNLINFNFSPPLDS